MASFRIHKSHVRGAVNSHIRGTDPVIPPDTPSPATIVVGIAVAPAVVTGVTRVPMTQVTAPAQGLTLKVTAPTQKR